MATQVQQPVPAATNQPRPAVVFGIPAMLPVANSPQLLAYKKVIRGLAISELVLGSICVLAGVIIACFHSSYYYGITTGEGIWCGVWIVVAGALGVSSARIDASPCMINCHLGFGIVGAVFAGILFSLGVCWSIFSYRGWLLFLFALMTVCAFTSMILLIVSASYTCCVNGCCSQQTGYYGGYSDGQVIYTQQPISAQGGGAINQPTTAYNGFQPMMPNVQIGYAQPVPGQMAAQPGLSGQMVQDPSSQKQQEAFSNQGYLNPQLSDPPSYDNSPTNRM